MKKLFALALLSFAIISSLFAAAPVLTANAVQVCYPGSTKPILNIVAGSAKTSYVSAAINDPTSPLAVKGILFTATNNPTSFTIISSKPAVVPVANVSVTLISGDQYLCKITPIAVGYSTITIKAENGSSSAAYTINVAASAASSYSANTIFPTGIADASGAAAIDDDYMLVANDETNVLSLYNRKNSGQALASFNITTGAGGVDEGVDTEEFDLEGATNSSIDYNSGKRIYWIASLGNSKSGNLKPLRDRVIATDISGSGATATVSVKSYSTKMRTALISWGDAASWNFTASAASGMIAKRIDGFNIEGLTLANGGEKAYIGFRAPCVPLKGVAPTTSNRKYAVLAPVTNFETMMDVSGSSTLAPVLDEPILFDFGGLGIRSIERVGGSRYIIEAGLFQGGGTPAVYLWDGVVPANSGANPIVEGASLIKLPFDLTDLVQASADGGVEGHPEALLCDQIGDNILAHIICDNGTVDYYNDATEAKLLANVEYMKFRQDTYVYSLTGAPALLLTSGSSTQTVNQATPISNIIYTWGGAATGVDVQGLPAGVSAVINTQGKNVMITGAPSVSGTFNYTITTTQASGTAVVLNGTINVTAPTIPLASPTGVSASVSGTTLNLNWPAVANATSYTVNLCKDSASTSTVSMYFNTSGSKTLSTGDIEGTAQSVSSSSPCYTPSAGSAYRTGSGNDHSLTLVNTDNVSELIIGGSSSSSSSIRTLNSYSINGGAAQTTGITQATQAICGEVKIVGLSLKKGDVISFTFSGNFQVNYFVARVPANALTCTETTVLANSFTATNLDENTNYTYQVKANTTLQGYSSSQYSSAASITSSTATNMPAVVANLDILQTESDILLQGISCTELSIYNMAGNKLASSSTNIISIRSLQKGLYIVRILMPDSSVRSFKFIKP